VSDRCNLRCSYCMPPQGGSWKPLARLPSLESLADQALWISRHFPVGTVRITGGEPTLRRGLPSFVRLLAHAPTAPELAMTTNGTRLAPLARELAEAGLNRVNVSLDTVDAERYLELTHGGSLDDALRGIRAAKQAGLAPVKVNAVLRRSSWREDVPSLLDFALDEGVELRFLELMRTGTERAWARAEFVAASEVLAWLRTRGDVEQPETVGLAPARRGRLVWRGHDMLVGWITPVSKSFCAGCDRLRLDAHGRLRRCLMDPDSLPLAQLLGEANEAQVLESVRGYLGAKQPPSSMRNALPMVGLGG